VAQQHQHTKQQQQQHKARTASPHECLNSTRAVPLAAGHIQYHADGEAKRAAAQPRWDRAIRA